MPQHRLRSGCATLLTRAEWRKAWGECSLVTRCVIATKAPHMYFQRDAMAATRQVLNASSVPSVYPRTRLCARRTAGNSELVFQCNDEPIAGHLPSENAHAGSGQQALKEGKIHADYPSDAILT
jgi:hypothetical protein